MRTVTVLALLVLLGLQAPMARSAEVPGGALFTPVIAATDLDVAACVQWEAGHEQPPEKPDDLSRVIACRDKPRALEPITFADSKQPGLRALRLAWKTAVTVGSVVVRGGGRLSVLKATARYPGSLDDDSQWLPAERMRDRQVVGDEVGEDAYAVWVLPVGTSTRALRFTHVAETSDKSYKGTLGGAEVLSERMVNLAPQALVVTKSRSEAAERITNEVADTWGAWDNGKTGAEAVVSPEHPESIILVWPRPVTVRGLDALWPGFANAAIQTYAGPADRHPRSAEEADWKTVREFEKIDNHYWRTLGSNWLDLGAPVTTRALRILATHVTQESHPHLNGSTKGGHRIWLGQLLALSPLGREELAHAILPDPDAVTIHPPVPVAFTLAEPGYVTLVIDDASGKRVRNLVSETRFPAGKNTAWWDAQDDLGRDTEAARHGLYHVVGSYVTPGSYRVHGLVRKAVDLIYEFSLYNPGTPPWMTQDNTGAWLTNHTPPSSTLFVPAESAPGGKPLVFIGSYVSEGGHGLAWVDLDGRKQGGKGWIGGAWTSAPYLARDSGSKAVAKVYAYVGAAWEKDLRLTALSENSEKPVAAFSFTSKETAVLAGIAVHDMILVCSLPKQKQLLFVDAQAGKVLGASACDDTRGLAFDGQGRLLVLAGKQVQRYALPVHLEGTIVLPPAQVLVANGLEDPQQITMDADGTLFVSDQGSSHQVKVFSADGKAVRAIGHAGEPKAGPYDVQHMNHPNGITIDANHHLWVAETDFQPKRVSVWSLDGQLLKTFYGPTEYGGGGRIDDHDKGIYYYHGMQFALDWGKGTSQITAILYRPAAGELKAPGDTGVPEQPIYLGGKRYFTNCYNSNPTGGASMIMLWCDRGGVTIPVAAAGRANDWDVLKGDAFKSRWPAGVNLRGDYWSNQCFCIWTDANGDGQMQPDEVSLIKASPGGMTVMPDLSLLAARIDGKVMRFAPLSFSPQGVPLYAIDKGEVVLDGAQGPVSSGGDQALIAQDGRLVVTNAAKPFSAYSVGGGTRGASTWSYPDMWPGLHASHESAKPEFPGELVGTTRLLGNFFTPRSGDAGPLWAINGNMGNIYLMTADGLFVATLFHDVRMGKRWSMPLAQRGMKVNDLTLSDENFWPSITQAPDGQVYLVPGDPNLVRIDGLDSIRRLPEATVTISEADLKQAQAFGLEREAERQKSHGASVLKVSKRTTPPTIDGKLDDWAGADWAVIDRSGVAANFDSNSKPYDIAGAVSVSADHLYAAWRTGDAKLLTNTGDVANAPFKTGGCLDLMLGTNAQADRARANPAEGDERLLVTVVKGKTLALLYRAVVPGTAKPVPFSSPWRTITIDRVDDISDQVRFAASDGNYEIAVPLAALNLAPATGRTIKADIGILRGSDGMTQQRVYWSNKATGITADVPSEAMLTPSLWGLFTFE